MPIVKGLREQLRSQPGWTRALPFLLFLGLTFCQTAPGEWTRFSVYAGKTVFGAWAIWLVRPLLPELRWAFSWEAVLVGVGVFLIWVGLEPWYPKLQELGVAWNPFEADGMPAFAAWSFVIVRLAGSTLVVPALEEVFYRSFLYRWIVRPDFESVPPDLFAWKPFLATSIVFGLGHREWLAGVICGMAYQWLVIRKGRLGDAMLAHALTNLALGLWVAVRGEWVFWS